MFHNTDEGFTVPRWLILTQLLVLFLLLALLFFFAVIPLDSDHHLDGVAVTPPPSTSSNVFFLDDIQRIDSPQRDSSPTTTSQHQGVQNQIIKAEIATGPTTRREEIIEEEEDEDEDEDEEEEEEEDASLYIHPCHYFQLATVAFLKCFGLDSTSDGPSTRKHRKRKES